MSEISKLFNNAVNLYDKEFENSNPIINKVIQKFLEIENKTPKNYQEKKLLLIIDII